MKKTLLLLASLSLFATQSNAVVLSFDDIPGVSVHKPYIPGVSIDKPYGNMPTYKGFTFSSALTWDYAERYPGAYSGDFALYNTVPGIITEENGADFRFDGLWAKYWDTPKNSGGVDISGGTVQGYKNDVQIWSVYSGLNGSYKYFGAQTGLIDELRLNFGANFLFDDINVSPVPEPSSIALMLGGLGLVGFMAARRAKKV